MEEQTHNSERLLPTIQFYTEYGVHKEGNVALVSAPNWEEAMREVENAQFDKEVVVLPELITVAGENLAEFPALKDAVEVKMARIISTSLTKPDTTFIVGSPHYVEGVDKPYNGAFVIKNGHVIANTHKRIGALTEEEVLTMDRAASPLSVENADVLICRDLSAISFQPRDVRAKQLFYEYATGDKDKSNTLMEAQFIRPDTKKLIVLSCWGIGMHPMVPNIIRENTESLNRYYQATLRSVIMDIFKHNPQIEEIYVSDRAPSSDDPVKDRVATKPMSVIARR